LQLKFFKYTYVYDTSHEQFNNLYPLSIRNKNLRLYDHQHVLYKTKWKINFILFLNKIEKSFHLLFLATPNLSFATPRLKISGLEPSLALDATNGWVVVVLQGLTIECYLRGSPAPILRLGWLGNVPPGLWSPTE